MNDWHKINEKYLAKSLHWLRLRLKLLAESKSNHEQIEGEISETARELQALSDGDLLPSAVVVGQIFGLTTFEQQIFLLCAAMELDTQVPALCAAAQDHPQRAYPTFALAMALFDHPAWEALSPDRPLRYWQLIEISQQMGQPLISAPLKADERVVNTIRGLNHLDDRLQPFFLTQRTHTAQNVAGSPFHIGFVRHDRFFDLEGLGHAFHVQLLGDRNDANRKLFRLC